MSNDTRDERSPMNADAGESPLRHFRVGRRAVLTSLTGLGAAAFALPAAAAHVHQAAAAASAPADAAATEGSLLFLDQHGFDTLAALSEQIVPGSRAAQVPEVLDRLLSVEALETQRRFVQALGAFEGQARAAQGRPWKALTAPEAERAAHADFQAARGRQHARHLRRLQARHRRDVLLHRAWRKRAGLHGQFRVCVAPGRLRLSACPAEPRRCVDARS